MNDKMNKDSKVHYSQNPWKWFSPKYGRPEFESQFCDIVPLWTREVHNFCVFAFPLACKLRAVVTHTSSVLKYSSECHSVDSMWR